MNLQPSLKIIKTILDHGSGLTWRQLKEKTSLSNGALSKHLNLLYTEGYIKTKNIPTLTEIGRSSNLYYFDYQNKCPVCGGKLYD